MQLGVFYNGQYDFNTENISARKDQRNELFQLHFRIEETESQIAKWFTDSTQIVVTELESMT